MDSSLSTKFLDVDLKLTEIYYHPKEVLVKFQGQYNTDYEFDYHILQKEIQQVPKVKDSIGVGDFCLVEESDCGEWYRGRVVEKKNHSYEVFLMDVGKILSVYDTHIACATEEVFQLPPKLVSGIFANILPVDEKWSPKAFNYFSGLRDLQIKGHIEAILQHQTLLLDVPKITSDIVELHLGKFVDGDTFRLIVEMLTEFTQQPLGKKMPDLLQQKYTSSALCNAGSEPEQPMLQSLWPHLSVGEVEKVKISVAVSPSKFYCQLLRQQMELDMLTTRMSSYYESISRENVSSFESLGILCAARSRQGQWHRGVIQQLLSDNRVKVWFMDFGSCQAVPSDSVLKLHPEFISLPMFAFSCALSCLNDQDETVICNQLEEFKEVLLRQTAVSALIDLFSAHEQLYYVTLQKHDSVVNTALPSQENDPIPKCNPPLNVKVSCIEGDKIVSGTNPVFSSCVDRNALQSEYSHPEVSGFMCSCLTISCRRSEMKIYSVCVAFVVYALNPSTFWIQMNDHVDDFNHLMKQISDVYDASRTEDKILENPQPGQPCCARYRKDMHFYRAVIREVVDNSIDVYFLDFGNTETVSHFDVRILLPEFQELPALAICCSLANASPVEDIWTKRETDFFKTVVLDKVLTVHPVAKQGNKYMVNMQYMNDTEQNDVLNFMVQAGYARYAECWKIKQGPFLNFRNSQVRCSKSKYKKTKIKSVTQNNKIAIPSNAVQSKKSWNISPVTEESTVSSLQWDSVLSSKCRTAAGKFGAKRQYKYYRFEPGTVLDVVCCYFASPGDFSCQIRSQLPELENLMEQMQSHYNAKKIPYESGQGACVVKHPVDGKWCRGVVLKHLSQTEAYVLFVDYGNTERVLLRNLQAILPDFLNLESQAFRCCIGRVTESLTLDPCNWSIEAHHDFQQFVSSPGELLTCTVSALVVRFSCLLYHVVDLHTSFISLQQFLLERGHIQSLSIEFTKSLIPSFSLCSFYYSSFSINIGSEEEVSITHIYSPTNFFCQLNRNAGEMHKLWKKITEISQMSTHTDQTGTLCLAKYVEDGLFYRALVSSAGLSDYPLVHFVDFGNKEKVTKNELLPIPDHASELLFTPMQAINCYLTDLKGSKIPVEINTWFENNYLGKQLKVVIVTKEHDGQLGVELYDGDLLINKKVKELLKDKKCEKKPKFTQKNAEKSARDENIVHNKVNAGKAKLKNQIIGQKIEKEKVKSSNQTDDKLQNKYGKEMVDLQKQRSRSLKLPAAAENRNVCLQNILGQRYRDSYGNFDIEPTDYHTMQSEQLLENKVMESHVLNSSSQEKNSNVKQTYTCLQQPTIKPHSKVLCYVSCITSLSNFYIHCAEDENKIVQLAEKLNGGTLIIGPETEGEIVEGDIVLAEYELDCFIYRAVVTEVKSDKSFEVEFIDYGNRLTVAASKIYKLGKIFLDIPRLSVHCFLSRAKCVFPEKVWNSDATAYFVSKVNNQPIVVEFLQQHGQQWEVDIFYQGISMISELMQTDASSDLQSILVLNVDQIKEHLPKIDADIDSNSPQKSKHPNASESNPKVACQKIKTGQLKLAEIVHDSREGNFCVKLRKNAEIQSDLNMMAAKEAERKAFLAVENIDGLDYTKSKANLNLYHVDIIKTCINEEHTLVFFMDLGKYEEVSVHDTQPISDKIRSISRNAALCKWIWIRNLSGLSFEQVANRIKCHEIKILFLKYLESAFICQVDILIDMILIFKYRNQFASLKCLEVSHNLQVNRRVQFKPNSIAWASFQINRLYPGFVTSITDPSDFSIQLEDSFEILKTLFKLLSDLPENLPSMPYEFIVPGASCLIKSGVNTKWNRAEVSEVSRNSGRITLTLLDDGLSATVPISDSHKLKVIPENLVTLPRLTYPCSLSSVSPASGECWSKEAKLKVQEFFCMQGMTFQFRHYDKGLKLEVDVFCGQTNVAEALVSSGCAVYSENVLGSINFAERGLLNSQNCYEPSKICYQKNSSAGVAWLTEKPQHVLQTSL